MSLFRGCRAATSMQVRGFTSSSSCRVGPESPNFVDIPRSLQAELHRPPRVKGTVPVPRELFPARRADKPSMEYLTAATTPPKRQPKIDPNHPHADIIAQKLVMAEMRRRNLREGLEELYKRKQHSDATMMNRSQKKKNRRDVIINQSDRRDELLTRSTFPQSLHRSLQPRPWAPVLPDPDRESRLNRSKKRMLETKRKKDMHTRDSLHTLYMNARNFIVTEEQLVAEIDRVFPDGDNPAFRSDQQHGDNIWNLGPPPALQSLAYDSTKNELARWDLIQSRLKKLGEGITGGKM